MKNTFFGIVAMLAASTAQAGNLNLFQCVSEDRSLEVSYSSSSFTGEPQMSVTIDGDVVFPPQASQFPGLVSVKSDESVFGKFVFGMDSSRTPVDAPSYIFGFFVPKMSLADGQRVAKFDSIFLKGSVGGHIPQWVPAQHINDTVKISCEAQSVVF